jgi:hypothetical protein
LPIVAPKLDEYLQGTAINYYQESKESKRSKVVKQDSVNHTAFES